ncbi:MAG: hypothetical protein U1F43_24485 [Myxococcota bacterium]
MRFPIPGMMAAPGAALVTSALALAGCGQAQAPTDTGGAHLAIGVAPLSLAGVSDACYALTVYGGTDPDTAPVVWSQAHVCASQFGDGVGSVAYVGSCDASASGGSGASVVQLVMEDLCTGGPCADETPGDTSIAASEWRNPCPAPEGCSVPATCVANRDTPVRFDLVVARSANQGFFDVAVNFSDVFCSAKLDCVDAQGGPLLLLNDPEAADQGRGPTVVVAWACTAGPGAESWLYYDNLVVKCFDDTTGALLGSWPYDPSLGPGNAGPGSAPFAFQTGVYRTSTASTGVTSWNVALGIHPDELPGRCVLTASASASDTRLEGDTTPTGAVYPFITWNVTLSAHAGALSCTRHPLDEADSGVATDYTRAGPKAFAHALKAGSTEVETSASTVCVDTVTSLDGRVRFASSPEGVTARVDGVQSPFYPLPAGFTLGGCCGDPCCE